MDYDNVEILDQAETNFKVEMKYHRTQTDAEQRAKRTIKIQHPDADHRRVPKRQCGRY